MDIRPIRNDADLAWATKEIARYFDAPPEFGTPDADRFDVLAALIAAYEDRHHPIDAPDPVEMIREYIDMTGRTQADLAVLLGSRSRASEILGRKRPLTMTMVHKLNREWGIPADVLVRPYRLAAA